MLRSFLIIGFTLITLLAQSQLQMPSIFGDSMVLQRDAPIRIWGKAKPGEKVTAVFHQQRKTVAVNSNGDWMVVPATEKTGGPYAYVSMKKNGNSIELSFSTIAKGLVEGGWCIAGI